MPQRKEKRRTGRPPGRPRKLGIPGQTVPASAPGPVPTPSQPSLPPAGESSAALPLPTDPHQSKRRVAALRAIAMRVEGHPDDVIAQTLGYSITTIRSYIYYAAQQGWVSAQSFVDPKEAVEYGIVHKVVRNLDQMLDSNNPAEKSLATMEVAKGTLFKRFSEAGQTAPSNMNMLSIRIEAPPNADVKVTEIREGSTGGAPAYVAEGEIHEPVVQSQK